MAREVTADHYIIMLRGTGALISATEMQTTRGESKRQSQMLPRRLRHILRRHEVTVPGMIIGDLREKWKTAIALAIVIGHSLTTTIAEE